MNLSDLQKDVDLYAHNTMRVHSQAQYFLIARTRQELLDVIQLAKREDLSLTLLGGGSNVVITKEKIEGIVVRNLYMQSKKVKETDSYVDISVSSGYPVSRLVNETSAEGLSGLEYHQGLPGTVGGAIYMNSKWTNPTCYFGDTLLAATVLDSQGNIKEVSRDYFHFAYDYSILHETHEIVLEATFRFKKEDPSIVKKRAADALAYRKETQPHGVSSSGCFFQNITESQMQEIGIDTPSAGNLIDKSGLKGARMGSFIVSPTHANFVINEGEGKPEDVAKLLQSMRSEVKNKYGIELKNEVVII